MRGLAQQLQEPVLRGNYPHVRWHRLGDHGGGGALGEGGGHRVRIVPRHDDRVGGLRAGHPGARGDPLRGEAGAGLGEEPVDMAVVGARELHDGVAARHGPREADRAHRRLSAGADHPEHLHRAEAVHHLARELHFALGRSAVARAPPRRLGDSRDDARVSVPEDQRPPRANPVDVPVPVHVDELRALAPVDEDRVVPADRAHRAHRRVDAAGHETEGPTIELG